MTLRPTYPEKGNPTRNLTLKQETLLHPTKQGQARLCSRQKACRVSFLVKDPSEELDNTKL